MSRLRHLPALDGLRGVAVAGVVLFHAGFTWLPGGFLGVSTFFTLSGFLITTLLLGEWSATGRIDLAHFWSRRARRLLPAALLTLLGVALYGALAADPHQLAALRADSISALGYVANWRFVISGHSYADLFSAPSPVQHFWSLAIEEQFYLVFPLLTVLLLGRTGRVRRLGIGLALLTTVSVLLPLMLWHPGHDPSRVYYGTDTRAAELLLGALLAVVLHRVQLRSTARAVFGWVGLGALGGLVAVWTVATTTDPWLYRGGLPLMAVLAVLVILGALAGGATSKVLSVAPLAALGRISYGVYLFHWPIFLWVDHARTGLGTTALFGLRAAVTLTLAIVSYRFVEQPIRSGRRLTDWRPRVLTPAAATLVAVTTLLVTVDLPEPTIVFAAASSSPPPAALASSSALVHTAVVPSPPPTSAAESSAAATMPSTTPPPLPSPLLVATRAPHADPLRIMVVGDSVAITVGRGLERWAPSNGAVTWNVALKWCAIGRGGDMGFRVNGATCDGWADRWAGQVARYDPDVVVVLSALWDAADRHRVEWGDGFHHIGEPIFDDWLTSEFDAAIDVLSAQGAHVLWLTAPCNGAQPAGDANTTLLDHVVIPRAAAARPAVTEVADLYGEVCPTRQFTDAYRNVADARPDGLHFSDQGTDALATWLGPLVLQAGRIAAGEAQAPTPTTVPPPAPLHGGG